LTTPEPKVWPDSFKDSVLRKSVVAGKGPALFSLLHAGDNTLGLNTDNLSAGIYFIAIESDQGRFYTGKLSKY
jgi:hypothetical protein